MFLVTRETCPVCASKKYNPFLTCKDYTVSNQYFNIVSCESCGFKFTNPVPDESNIGKYYKSENYVSHSDTKKGLINKLYHTVRDITLKQKLALINNPSPKGKILDIGCGTGYFINTCKNDGWNITATEPDEDARKQACGLIGQDVESDLFNIKDINSFNIITMWHVLEHIHQLNESIAHLYTLLKPNGTIVIAVPNCESRDAKTYKEYWAAYDVPRHLYHFTQSTMDKLLVNHGFEKIKTVPMKFDAFYISMVSEKYKKGKSNLLLSFLNGIKSNFSAKDNNYSSIIYIYRKK